MSWFKVDDGFGDHPKVLEAGNEAVGVWVRCGAWSAKHLENGRIPARIASDYGRKRTTELLVASGLWLPTEGGYVMHDYHDYNPTAEQVKREREATRERVAKWRSEHRSSRGTYESSNAVTNGVSNGHPDPTRPVEEHLHPLPTSTVDKLDDWTREHLI